MSDQVSRDDSYDRGDKDYKGKDPSDLHEVQAPRSVIDPTVRRAQRRMQCTQHGEILQIEYNGGGNLSALPNVQTLECVVFLKKWVCGIICGISEKKMARVSEGEY